MSRILLIGGPGNISTSTIEALLERNHELAVFTLPESPDKGLEKKVRFFRGDRNNPKELRKTVKDFKPELSADVCCFTPDQAKGLVDVLRGKVKKHVFVSTVDVYGYPLKTLPYRESDPRNRPVSQYAANKLACETVFWAEHEQGNLPLAVGRPSYSFGPQFVLNLFSRFDGLQLLSRLRCGRTVVVPGDGSRLIHPGSAHNTGRMLAALIEGDTAGQDFTLAHPSYMSQDDYYRLFAEALGVEAQIVHVPKELLFPLQKKLIPDDLLSELTQFHLAFSVDKFKHFFPDFQWTRSLEQAAREYVVFHDERGDIPDCHDSYEDRIISAWEDSTKRFEP